MKQVDRNIAHLRANQDFSAAVKSGASSPLGGRGGAGGGGGGGGGGRAIVSPASSNASDVRPAVRKG